VSKIGDLGKIPSWWDGDATPETFLKPWPTFPGKGTIGPLEPYGYPSYEGYGYPGAGYGVSRSKVVGLEHAKVSAPQLTNKGWEGKVPVGTRVTPMGTLNSRSDDFSRAQVSVLQGLRGLSALPENTTAAQIADWITNGTMSQSFINDLTDKVVRDEKSVTAAWLAIEALKKAGKTPNPADVKAQQDAWRTVNNAKVWMLMLPTFQYSLGFAVGKPKVSKPDYNAFKAQAEYGNWFSRVWNSAQQAAIKSQVQNLIDAGYITGSLNGLGAPPAAAAVIAVAVAIPVGLGIYAYIKNNEPATIEARLKKQIIECELDKSCPPGTLDKYKTQVNAANTTTSKIADTVTYAAVGLTALAGVGLTIYLINKFRG
jgi:hypothetical protein